MKQMVEARAVLLSISPSGENFQKLHLLSAERGGMYALIRRPSSRRTKPAITQPDLFDHALIGLEATSHNESVFFVRSYELERRHSGIAADYRRLTHASRFARILAANINQMLHSEELFQLTCRTFHLFESRARSEIVLFKALYLLFRTEGYPVGESWLVRLNSGERESCRKLIGLVLDPPETTEIEAAYVTGLTERLLSWAEKEIDFSVS